MPKVEIYTRAFCGYCYRAKRLLDSKGIEYQEHEVFFSGAEKQAMIQRSSGRTTVPQIFIDDRHIGGCTELMELESRGKLDELLTA
ncbi:glutaredoxin 3 [Sphingomonas sp.]|uniref:glutaredoxin 3 n=1 Tax=Sphingomonas sp. TaxID=28214 RepID=UPI0017A56536|nr:glutaredoxin 3 [Sphingomonas sp.]MBA3512436.1 glutaredoxin 3 [Sphingomonas sp.]